MLEIESSVYPNHLYMYIEISLLKIQCLICYSFANLANVLNLFLSLVCDMLSLMRLPSFLIYNTYCCKR